MKLSYEQLAVEVDKVYTQNTQESQADKPPRLYQPSFKLGVGRRMSIGTNG